MIHKRNINQANGSNYNHNIQYLARKSKDKEQLKKDLGDYLKLNSKV